MRTAKKTGAFTLVELLVVMSIIAVLAALLVPAIGIARRKAQEAASKTTIHNCEMAAQAFFNDYGDYPPSTWAELDNVFDDADVDADGPGSLTTQNWGDGDFYEPSTVNEGIEVLLACLATQTGGPYLEVGEDMLGNTDYDYDADLGGASDLDVLESTNWLFGGTEGSNHRPLYELVDFWGNPLVYVHNRDYTAFDPNESGTAPYYAEEGYVVLDAGGNVNSTDNDFRHEPVSVAVLPALNAPPNLNSFQLYSWGYDGVAGDYDGSADEEEEWEDNLRNWEE